MSVREFFSEHNRNNLPDPGNIKLLQNKINQKIVVARDEILLFRSIKVLLSLADQLVTLLRVKSDTLKLPVHELEKKRESMQHSIDYLASGKEDFDAVVKNRIQLLIVNVTEQTEQKRKDLNRFYYNLLIENSSQTWLKLKEVDVNDFSSELAKQIIKEFDDLKTLLEQSVKEEFSNILLQYSTLSQSFFHEIIKQMNEVLGIHIEGIISSFDLEVYTSFYFKTDIKYSIRSVRKNIFYKILSGKVVKSMILRQIYTNCKELINPNAGRMRGDIEYKINESYRKFKYHFDQKLYDLLQSLKSMIEDNISTKSSIYENIEETLEKLKSEQSMIEEIKERYSVEVKGNR